MMDSLGVGRCHQKIRKDQAAEEDSNDLFGRWWEGLDTSIENAIVREIDRESALPIILRYEWLRTLPANCIKYAGLNLSGVLSGAVCFTNVKFGGHYTVFGNPAWCLARGASAHWAPPWAGSLLVSRSCKLLFGKGEPIIVVAYSDWSAGEIGTIYQACGWSYLGHSKTKEYLGPYGKRYDTNTPAVRACTGFARRENPDLRASKEDIEAEKSKMLAEGYRLVDGPIRGRYATAVGKSWSAVDLLKNVLIQHSKPYPKRANIFSEVNDA
jgi:hypothetical protein